MLRKKFINEKIIITNNNNIWERFKQKIDAKISNDNKRSINHENEDTFSQYLNNLAIFWNDHNLENLPDKRLNENEI